jgi:Acyclic terpene utilisation family protein AtuA
VIAEALCAGAQVVVTGHVADPSLTVGPAAAGLINILPWGGPTIRAAAAMQLPVTVIFNPLIPVVCR